MLGGGEGERVWRGEGYRVREERWLRGKDIREERIRRSKGII